jgi:hypothetical protein
MASNYKEYFINYPEQVDPTAPIQPTSDASDASEVNNNYASVLLFLKNNPSKSGKFIADIKNKFFDKSCSVKNNIDFPNLAQFTDGMPF